MADEELVLDAPFLHEVNIVAGPIEVCVKGPADDPRGDALELFKQVWDLVKGSQVFKQDRSNAGTLGFCADSSQPVWGSGEYTGLGDDVPPEDG